MLRGLLVPGRCAVRRHHDGLVGTSTAATVEAEPAAYLTRIQILMSEACSLLSLGAIAFPQLDGKIRTTTSVHQIQLDGTNRVHNPISYWRRASQRIAGSTLEDVSLRAMPNTRRYSRLNCDGRT